MGTSPTSFEDHDYSFQWGGRNSNALSQLNCVLPSVQSLGERMYRSVDPVDPVQVLSSEDSDICWRRHLMSIQSGKERDRQHFNSAKCKGLSLTLGSNLPSNVLIPSFHYRQTDPNLNLAGSSHVIGRGRPSDILNPGMKQTRDDYSFCGGDTIDNTYGSTVSQDHSGSNSNELVSITSIVRNPRYLKPAQHLLKEVVSVNKAVGIDSSKLHKDRVLGAAIKAGKTTIEQTRNMYLYAEKHDIQNRITKLVALLHEVDNRYKQYRQQMEEVESSFEAVAGSGTAKSYTALALQAMSRHFGSLRDAIIARIHVARQCLSDEIPKIHGGFSQLSLFDQNTRQKRPALQQLGMMQTQQAWRPLRGLPENSVAVLRAWLFEHFLHPYPSDSEKLMLASQTGLSRNQVANWFINGRVRLWKPMIEEMYREEISDDSADSNQSFERTSINEKCVSN
ncbi:BEL1-like homeodomain protein 11 [Tasmannia lanceolata]|uniref:BEL1-like homeodomain protein 11 n=1 Tax=Tasmannia lanceolata TaxID=3420 RepID=UPI004062A920